jgi:hypothetical protein
MCRLSVRAGPLVRECGRSAADGSQYVRVFAHLQQGSRKLPAIELGLLPVLRDHSHTEAPPQLGHDGAAATARDSTSRFGVPASRRGEDRPDSVRSAWNDPEINVDWPIAEPILSPCDQNGMSLQQYLQNPALIYQSVES